MRSWWTIGRVAGIGSVAGVGALLLWLPERAYFVLAWPLLAASAIAGLCGFSILAITAADLLFHRRRGPRLRPVRAFDLVLGVALVLLASSQFRDLTAQGLFLTIS
jgi:hypothetical protein